MAPQADRYYLEKKSWEEKAQSNPLYAVMSVDEFVVSGSTPNQEELKKFYTAGNNKVRKWIHPWLLETETKPEMKILEFGCGMGRLLKSLCEFHPPENLYGVDISKTMISHAKKNLPRAIMLSCLKEDATFPYPDSYFDRVYSWAVFQHIKKKSDLVKSIKEISRTLKVGGKVKLQFMMASPPKFGKMLKKDSFAFENFSLNHERYTKFIVPIWKVKLIKSNNWIGTRLGYRQLMREFRKNGIDILGIAKQPPHKKYIWVYGEKVETR